MSSAENIYRVTDWRARVCWLTVVCQWMVATISRGDPCKKVLNAKCSLTGVPTGPYREVFIGQ